ncbi:F0F1 ATP synthase subunit delta [Nitratiruptor sp. YY09-18]|uniref:F0F1 ATP synthase subunit delta n=1 Tax=Nitratiruptor sp. YY09-18 TaxID=2724901 RepID=UPI001915EF48|nr:F0F1 ATP synthase subunit delta [Nitratiruptor sp. YY09-18]BCD67779.1 F-type H+-transporting ATPase subunit delta [Nitratiruptor sp. YY09-18]
MEELIAKRYIKALVEVSSLEELKAYEEFFTTLANLFKERKIKETLTSPEVKSDVKLSFLLDAVKGNKKLENFIKILAQKNRFSIIPSLAKELQDTIAKLEKKYIAKLYSSYELSQEELQKLAQALAKRVGADVEIEKVDDAYDGLKVEVETAGVEIDFSKSKIKKQLIENILQAI